MRASGFPSRPASGLLPCGLLGGLDLVVGRTDHADMKIRDDGGFFLVRT